MDPLILAFVTAWLLMRGWEAVKAEWRHTRDGYARTLGKDHPDWSPARVRRNARHAARSWWWTEAGAGLPTFRASWEKNKLLARIQREEMLAAGEQGLRALRERLKAVTKAREDAAAAGRPSSAPEPAPDGTPGKPTLTSLPGGKAPARTGTPIPGTPAEPPVPSAPEPPAAEPPAADGTPEPPAGAPEPEPPAPGSTLEDPPTEGENVTTTADLETGDSKYGAMLNFLTQRGTQAQQAASVHCEDLDAAGSSTGLSRPPAVSAAFAAIKDAEQAVAAAYASAAKALAASHEQGKEYHEDGQGANREAFTSS